MSKLLEQINTAARKPYRIRDMGRVITGKTPSKDNPLDWGNEVDFITPTDFSGNEKYLSNIKRKISQEGVVRYKNMILPPESVVTTCIGSDMGKVIVSKNRALTNQQINSIIIDKESFDLEFSYYVLKSLYPTLRSIAEECGSTMPIITKSVFEQIEFEAPNLPVQKKIAEILSAYDAKIENNNKIIKNLEATAQTIFNEWFINFRFPGYEKVKMIDSEMGEIPEGWEVNSLNNIAEIMFGFNFKAKKFNEEKHGVPVVRIRDVLEGTTQTFTPEIPNDEYQIDVGDLLIGMDGTFHCSFWYTKGAYLNQRVARIRSKLPGYFIFESVRLQLDFLQKTITGATVGHLANGDIRNFKVLVPSDISILSVFENITQKILTLKKEIMNLKESRDRLLLKLI